jgi:hypothetical protein
MDSIKKKMRDLALATEQANVRTRNCEEEIRSTNVVADGFEDQVIRI